MLPFAALAEQAIQPPARGFISSQPANSWEQALISGNGRMGALVYGQTLDETIVLNHARLFMPLHPPLPPPDTASHLQELRDWMAANPRAKAYLRHGRDPAFPPVALPVMFNYSTGRNVVVFKVKRR